MHLSLVNLDPKVAATVEARIEGPAPKSVSGRVLTAPAMDTHNTFAAPDRVQPTAFNGASLQGPVLKAAAPAAIGRRAGARVLARPAAPFAGAAEAPPPIFFRGPPPPPPLPVPKRRRCLVFAGHSYHMII